MRALAALALGLALAACGGDGENTGQSCDVADDCYPEIDHTELAGEVECIDRVTDGYCTHLCQTDNDCCAVEGECDTDHPQVCAPFENTTVTRCFLSCEAADVGDQDENDYCAENAHPDFICRSTGGGGANRKVCVPEG